MEVCVVGPTLGIEVTTTTTPTPCVRDFCSGGQQPGKDKHHHGGGGGGGGGVIEQDQFQPTIAGSAERDDVGFGLAMCRSDKPSSDSESPSSSIGCSSGGEDEEEEEEEEEVESKFKFGGSGRLNSFASMASLEDSLPIKRGLSNYYAGKSKSFANLSDVSEVKDLEKQESPYNKRRRTQNACKWARKSSFYSWSSPKSMPLLGLSEKEDDTEDHQEEEQVKQEERPKVHEKKFRSFKTPSCFSLADMQGQHA